MANNPCELLELVYDRLNNNNFTIEKAVTLDSQRPPFRVDLWWVEAADIWRGGGGFEAAEAAASTAFDLHILSVNIFYF